MQQKLISSNTRLLALFGNPARHSLSPVIQNCFMTDNGIDAVYMTFEFPEKRSSSAFEGARDLGIYGLNITMPYKEKAFDFSDFKDERAVATGSVNTIRFHEDGEEIKSFGYNTDIDGFLMSLDEKGCILEEAECLVIGAGGAARSAVYALLERKVAKIYIYNRTRQNAEKIKDDTAESQKIFVLDNLEDRKNAGDPYYIFNCSPIGMNTGNLNGLLPLPDDWDLNGKVVFETIYKPLETSLVKKGRKEGAIVIDGLDMLINQAASSFNKWFGILPETKGLKEMLIKKYIKK